MNSAKYYLDKSFTLLNTKRFRNYEYQKMAVLKTNGSFLYAKKNIMKPS